MPAFPLYPRVRHCTLSPRKPKSGSSMRSLAVAAFLSTGALAFTPIAADHETLRGFTPASSKVELDWEAKFNAIPDPARMREVMRLLSARRTTWAQLTESRMPNGSGTSSAHMDGRLR